VGLVLYGVWYDVFVLLNCKDEGVGSVLCCCCVYYFIGLFGIVCMGHNFLLFWAGSERKWAATISKDKGPKIGLFNGFKVRQEMAKSAIQIN